MCRLRKAIHQKRTELRKNQSWSLQHNNAPAHISMFVHKFLAKNKSIIMSQFIGLGTRLYFPHIDACAWIFDQKKKNTAILPQSPFSKHLAFVDFFLFPKLKTAIKGKHFTTIEVKEIKNEEKSNHGFYTMITHQLTHIDACTWVLGQKQNRNHASTTVFTGFGPCYFFLFPKLKATMKWKRFTIIEEIKEKLKQELLVISTSVFQKCFENWKKC